MSGSLVSTCRQKHKHANGELARICDFEYFNVRKCKQGHEHPNYESALECDYKSDPTMYWYFLCDDGKRFFLAFLPTEGLQYMSTVGFTEIHEWPRLMRAFRNYKGFSSLDKESKREILGESMNHLTIKEV